MSWASVIDGAEDTLTIAALVGAIWSAYAFITRVGQKKELSRRKNVELWWKTAIHRVVANSEQFLKTSEILHKLMTESFDVDIKIKRDDLTEPEVRRVLIEMVSEGVLGQRWPDTFGITQLPHDLSVPLVQQHLRGNYAARDTFRLIHDYPGQYDDDRLWSEVGQRSGLSKSDFVIAISELRTRALAKKDANGKWILFEAEENVE